MFILLGMVVGVVFVGNVIGVVDGVLSWYVCRVVVGFSVVLIGVVVLFLVVLSWWVIIVDRFRLCFCVIVLVIFWLYILWNMVFLVGKSELLKLVLCMFLISICVNWFFSWCVILLILVGLLVWVGLSFSVGVMCMLDYFEFGV